MPNLLSGRLLAAAGVWAILVTVGSPGPITAAGVAGTLVGSVLLMAVVKLVYQKSRATIAARRTSSEAQSG